MIPRAKVRLMSISLRAIIATGLILGVILGTVMPPVQASKVPPRYKDANYSVALHWAERKTSKTCPSPRWIRPTKQQLQELKKRPGKGQRIAVIGDSLTREAYWNIAQGLFDNGWLPTLVCWGGKTTQWGLQQLKRLSVVKRLPRYVVMITGTNDMLYWATPRTFNQRVKATVQYLRKKTKRFWWMNTSFDLKQTKPRFRSRLAQYRKFNKSIGRYLKTTRTKGSLINWNSQVSHYPKKWISRDGIHDTAAGRKYRAAVIANRVQLANQ